MANTSASDNVKTLLEGIRDERGLHANTSTRVGQAMLALLSLITDGMEDIYLRKDVFDALFNIVYNTDGTVKTIVAKKDFYSLGEISAFGEGVETTAGGTSYNRLDDWLTYDSTKQGWVVSAALGYELYDKISQLQTKDGDKNFSQYVAIPSKVWTVMHSLNKYPAVTVVNNDGQTVEGSVRYLDANTVEVSFSAEFSGTIYCN